jgi:hypothetical protein
MSILYHCVMKHLLLLKTFSLVILVLVITCLPLPVTIRIAKETPKKMQQHFLLENLKSNAHL